MCRLVTALLIVLAVLHQDFWWWDDRTVVLGVMPIGLAWHAFISLAAGALWYLATVFCWPAILKTDPLGDLKQQPDQPAAPGEEEQR